MFQKTLYRLLSMVLVLVLLAQMLPAEVLGAEVAAAGGVGVKTGTAAAAAAQPEVVAEVPSGRSRYGKEFMLSNGLHLAVLYPEPVHYQADGQWVEIDTTLKRSGTVYTTTAGDWQVSLPTSLGTGTAVSVTKDGYTLGFRMAGELRSSGNLELMGTGEQYQVQAAQASSARVENVDLTEIRAASEHPETVLEKLQSRLRYESVYTNTDIVYDVTPSRLKESIVLESYNSTLRGYRFTLETGDLTPVLAENGTIGLFAPGSKEPIMTMPAPYLLDGAMALSQDVDVELSGSGGTYTLTYRLPTAWLADAQRQWPVILDPIITVESNALTIQDVFVAEQNMTPDYKGISLEVGHNDWYGIYRSFLKYPDLPALTSADTVVYARLTLQNMGSSTNTKTVEIHKVLETWESSSMTWSNQPDIDPLVEDFARVQAAGNYVFDITDIVRGWYEGENTGLAITAPKAVEEAPGDDATVTRFFSSDSSYVTSPVVHFAFRNSNGLESYWDYTSASAGRAGSGYVNNYTGNLVWVRGDMGFGGNRMPVSISHIYNADDAATNEFGLGNGWRTNYHQRVYRWTEDTSYYVWEDSDGTRHYFEPFGSAYKDEDGLELILTTTGGVDWQYRIEDKQGNCSYFDASGRLTKLENNQKAKSNIAISYGTGNRINTITDGVGRVYKFEYVNNLLNKIKYWGNHTETEGFFAETSYTYDTAPNLTAVTDNDGSVSRFTYEVRTHNNADNVPVITNLLKTAKDVDGYTLTYSYYPTSNYYEPNRVSSVRESSGTTAVGSSLSISYGQNQTTLTDRSGNVQILQFNNWGNTVAVQDNQGRAQYAQYANNDASDTTAANQKGNQLQLASKLQNTVGNLLVDSSFEGGQSWGVNSGSVSASVTTEAAYIGSKSLKLVRPTAGAQAGAYGSVFSVTAGETYTFSAWVKTGTARAYLVFWDGSRQETSEILPANSDWTRLEVSYTATSSGTIQPHLLTQDAGTIYMDCVQLEKAASASRYNLLQNGDFRIAGYWSSSAGRTTGTAAAPQLDGTVYSIAGSPTATGRVYQDLGLSGAAGDTFAFGGWASAQSVPLASTDSNSREFAIIATIHYTDGETEVKTARFNPYVSNWQYTAEYITAEKSYSSIRIQLAYDYNANTALFDGIQLYKEQFGSHYTYDEDGNLTQVTDLNGSTTTYTYSNANDLTKIEQPNGAETTYEYEYHNVTKATTDTGVVYTYGYDKYGNNTSVIVSGGGITLVSSAEYTDDYNRLESVTDTAGNVTTYNYHENTNVLLSVQYPGDTQATQTNYEYDEETYRLQKVTAATNQQNTLQAVYTYNEDKLTSLQTGTTTYSFAYDGPFDQVSRIGIGNRTLAQYQYAGTTEAETSLPGPVLSRLDYGNNDHVQYSYDSQGRQVLETYEDGDTVSYAYDNNGALSTVTDSATGIKTRYVYDLVGRLSEISRKNNSGLLLQILRSYDGESRLTSQTVSYADGKRYTTSLTYNPNGTPMGMTSGVVGTGYDYDELWRIEAIDSEINVIDRSFAYRTNPSTSQITKLLYTNLKGGYAFDYTYDSRGNIASYHLDCTNNGYDEAEFEYTYDTQNQLVSATDGTVTYTYTYDNGGNITAANGHTYTYGDSEWKDLLTAYDGQSITYDGIGNPTSYYNGTRWSFTWEHGRELVSASNGTSSVSYSYDADGLRTSKTVGGVVYNYYYVGSQLARMTYGTTVLDFFYDATGVPVAMRQGSTTSSNYTVYYYITNLQGDVIRLVDVNGSTAAYYEYDPYGKAIQAAGSHATVNPLRYRGYVYDTETGFYYLQSRYYDPQIGRFINADAYASTGQGLLGNNMFAYCLNNPICRIDIGGAVSAKCLDYDEDLINEAPGTDDIGPGGGNRYINNDTFYSSLYNTANKYDISPNQRVVNSGMVQRGEYVIYNSWQSAEQGMRVSMGSANDYYSRTFSTGEGNRVVDGYNQSTEVIGESKYGYQSLSAFIRSEIERDAMLLLTSKVKAVEWHFYYSVASGSIGGSYNLICALDAAGITVIYHY